MYETITEGWNLLSHYLFDSKLISASIIKLI